MNFALIIPTYNFKFGIVKTFSRIIEWRRANALTCEVYLIDDGSTDGTLESVQSFVTANSSWCHLLKHPTNRGKGAAVRTGFEATKQKHDYVVLMDCDLHYGLDIVTDRMLPELLNNDLVILDRSWTKEAHGLFLRRLASGLFNRMVSILTGVTFKDTQAGLKGFKVRTCISLFDLLRLEGFALDVEILSLASFYRFRIAQLPISLDDVQMVPKHSTINLLKAPWIMVYDLLRINLNWKRGLYEHPLLRQRVSAKVYHIQNGEKNKVTSDSDPISQTTIGAIPHK